MVTIHLSSRMLSEAKLEQLRCVCLHCACIVIGNHIAYLALTVITGLI